jgi:tRNA uridine 5-carboxymethylaminomethyl modification enzyme
MFTSRAEYRLILREDNADLRLTERGHQLGLVDEARWVAFNQKREAIDNELKRISKLVITPESRAAQELNKVLEKPLSRAYKAQELLRRPDVSYDMLMSQPELGPKVEDAKVSEQVQIQTKYSGYIDRQKDEIERNLRNEHTELPSDMDYTQVKGLSNEVAQKLQNLKPETIGQASRISGVTPAAISLLLVYLKKRKHLKSA